MTRSTELQTEIRRARKQLEANGQKLGQIQAQALCREKALQELTV